MIDGTANTRYSTLLFTATKFEARLISIDSMKLVYQRTHEVLDSIHPHSLGEGGFIMGANIFPQI